MAENITARDILEKARQCHHRQGDFYEALASRADDRRVAFMSQQLCRHEREFEEKLRPCSLQHASRLMDTRLDFDHGEQMLQVNTAVEDLPAGASVAQIGELANHFDQVLIDYYHDVAVHVQPGDVRELFLSLAAILRFRKSIHAYEILEARTALQ